MKKRRFRVEDPAHSENVFSQKKRYTVYLLYRSTRPFSSWRMALRYSSKGQPTGWLLWLSSHPNRSDLYPRCLQTLISYDPTGKMRVIPSPQAATNTVQGAVSEYPQLREVWYRPRTPLLTILLSCPQQQGKICRLSCRPVPPIRASLDGTITLPRRR